jgi:hypothetical protein
MFEVILLTLSEGISKIDAVLKQRIEERKQVPSNLLVATWSEDATLKEAITSMTNTAHAVSTSGIKLVLLMRARPSPEVLRSLLDETAQQLEVLVNQYR